MPAVRTRAARASTAVGPLRAGLQLRDGLFARAEHLELALTSAWLATAVLIWSIWLFSSAFVVDLLGELLALHLVKEEEAHDLEHDDAEHDEQPGLARLDDPSSPPASAAVG